MMGLFSKKNIHEQGGNEPSTHDEFIQVEINLTDKMLRVEIEDGNGYVKHGVIRKTDDCLRISSSGGIVLADITKRSKAFKELEPYIGQSAESIVIKARTGDYGEYYQVRMKFKKTVAIF